MNAVHTVSLEVGLDNQLVCGCLGGKLQQFTGTRQIAQCQISTYFSRRGRTPPPRWSQTGGHDIMIDIQEIYLLGRRQDL